MHRRDDWLPRAPLPPREIADPLPPPDHELDAKFPCELNDDAWDALLPDDDYESMPDPNDFWIDAED